MSTELPIRVQIGKDVKHWINELQEHFCSTYDTNVTMFYFWREFVTELRRQELLRSEAASQSPTEYTDEQGESFGKALCPFNKYKDVAYRAVPYDYLAFIVDSNKELERYLKWRFKKGMTQ